MSEALRRQLCETARSMNVSGINQGKSGNLSARLPAEGSSDLRCLVTPSAVPYDELVAEDIVELASDGSARGRRPPSSEWSMHLGILRARPEVGAVLHAHPTFSTALACHGRRIPAFHYMVAIAGGSDIRCAPYATFGTSELATHAVRALEGRRACLLSHHGLVVLGSSPGAALALAIEVETLARQYWHSLLLGEPPELSAQEMALVLEKFESYGKPR
ncbi:MAG TPA: class II aldolase/adducin family protein [Polyangiaceae bacterium]|nr:class II aldolase/adducin family protein [Polyangiaceae bacterium]